MDVKKVMIVDNDPHILITIREKKKKKRKHGENNTQSTT